MRPQPQQQELPPVQVPQQEQPQQEEPPADVPDQEPPPVRLPEQEEPVPQAALADGPPMHPADQPVQELPAADVPIQEQPPADLPVQEPPPARQPEQEEPVPQAANAVARQMPPLSNAVRRRLYHWRKLMSPRVVAVISQWFLPPDDDEKVYGIVPATVENVMRLYVDPIANGVNIKTRQPNAECDVLFDDVEALSDHDQHVLAQGDDGKTRILKFCSTFSCETCLVFEEENWLTESDAVFSKIGRESKRRKAKF